MNQQQTSNARRGRLAGVGPWILKGCLALAFLAAAFLKLTGNPKMVAEFGEIGLGQWFRYLTGVIEVVGAGLLLWPRTALLGSLTLLGICGGALVAQLGPLHGDLIHVFVLATLLALISWLSRPARAS
jgi:uncharacterized membrane protein YphA (DoxX/SURF4 family)